MSAIVAESPSNWAVNFCMVFGWETQPNWEQFHQKIEWQWNPDIKQYKSVQNNSLICKNVLFILWGAIDVRACVYVNFERKLNYNQLLTHKSLLISVVSIFCKRIFMIQAKPTRPIAKPISVYNARSIQFRE